MYISPQLLQRPDWLQIWAGSWSILSCSHFAEQYSRLIKFNGRPFLPESIIIIRNGKSEGWARQKDREAICKHLAEEIKGNHRQVKIICLSLKRQADELREFMVKHKNVTLTEKLYNIFWNKLVKYYQPHINVKYIVDGLTSDQLKKSFRKFEEARLYAEDVLTLTEQFMEKMAKKIGKNEKISTQLVLCCIKDEMINYFRTGKLPSRDLLKKRDKLFGIYCDKNRFSIYNEHKAESLVKVLAEVNITNTLRGMTAYSGKVKGVVRVVHDPNKVKKFNTGDVLVSGMTRPEFLSLMKKASAFVTDSGGILSHAAIVARELKKPCIIGTKIATKILKDGDTVEVDAANGIIKKI